MKPTYDASELDPVSPTSPVAPYVGGKRLLSRHICSLIETAPHRTYAEPFVGMGGVFFRRALRPRSEVINDISADVVNLFRILQRHYQSFLDELKWRLSSRAEFARMMATDPDSLTDLERAARFLYVQRLAFGGKVVGRSFGVSRGSPARFDLTKLVPMLEDVHERLAGVVIERMPYQAFISRYDRADTLFYLDPPYFGTEGFYGPTFSPADFTRLRDLLGATEGRFILSINDCPEIREIFAGFRTEEVALSYTVGTGARPAQELVISRL